jgi:hypothetical protein
MGAGPENTVGNHRGSAGADCGWSVTPTHADTSVVPLLRKLISGWMTAPATNVVRDKRNSRWRPGRGSLAA